MAYRFGGNNNNRFGEAPTAEEDQRLLHQQAMALANQIVAEREEAARLSRLGRVYTEFQPVDQSGVSEDILSLQIETVTRGLFAGNTGSLVNMFTSSLLTATQKSYYQEIFSTGDPSSNESANSELSVAYGHFNGSGSLDTTGNLNNDTPSRAIYRQYAQVLLDPADKKFTFDGTDSDHIYVMNFNRARMREKLDPGNFEITLAVISGNLGTDLNNSNHIRNSEEVGDANQTAGKFIQICDDSSINDPTAGEAGLVYNLVSGSIDGGTSIYNAASPVHYGLLYPQHGIAILSGDALDNHFTATTPGAGFASVTSSQVEGYNAEKLIFALQTGSAMTDATRNGGIQARSSEQVKSTYFFIRVKNGDYNYSNNPTFTTGSFGEVAFASMVDDPQIYITTIGLYNYRKELLATAKLSQPLLKNFTREALIKVKLDF